MGYVSAFDMAEQTDLTTALTWHLRANCFPPIPLAMLTVAKQAIAKVLSGDRDYEIPLPDGITWRGEDQAPAWSVIDGLCLAAFVDAGVGTEE
jgi:hypothetical protein